MRAARADVVLCGGSYDAAEERAAALAASGDAALVHPFDHPDTIEGQGTIALELAEQLPDLDEVLVPLSGGGWSRESGWRRGRGAFGSWR